MGRTFDKNYVLGGKLGVSYSEEEGVSIELEGTTTPSQQYLIVAPGLIIEQRESGQGNS